MSNYNSTSRKIITSWYNRAKNGNESYNYFDRFISLWVSFNCFFVAHFYGVAKKNKNGDVSEQSYLKKIYRNEEYKKIYAELLQTKEFKDEIKTFFDYLNGDEYITHFKGKIADMRPNMLTEDNAKPFDDLNNFEQFIRVTYQIRCNLFHGNKSPDRDGDVMLVESIFKSFFMFLTKVYQQKNYFIPEDIGGGWHV